MLERGEVLEVPTAEPLGEQGAWSSFRDVLLGLEYREYLKPWRLASFFQRTKFLRTNKIFQKKTNDFTERSFSDKTIANLMEIEREFLERMKKMFNSP